MIGALLVLVACTPQDDPEAVTHGVPLTGTAGTADTGSPSTANTDPVPPGEPPPTATVEGVVVGPDGQALEGVNVTLCHRVCRFADTDADGGFRWDEVIAQSYALHFTTFGAGGLADVLVAIDVAEDEQVRLERSVPMATLGKATLVTTPTEVEVAPGVFLTVDPAAVALPPFSADNLQLAGTIPASQPPGLPEGVVLETVYLAPFDATADPGLSLRVTNRWGLAPGETVAVRVSSYTDYAWIDGGTLTVEPDGNEIIGGSLPVLSTFVLLHTP